MYDGEESDNQYDDLDTDVYSMKDEIGDEFKYGNTNPNRNDTFKAHFESIFNTKIEDIDDVEGNIVESTDSEKMISVYKRIRSDLEGLFDTYYGITFDNGPDINKIDLNKLYMAYRVIYLNFAETMAVALVGRAISNKYPEITPEFAIDFFQDENEFIVDNIQHYMELGDPGNVEYEYVFGKTSNRDDDYVMPEVFIDNSVFRTRVCYELYRNGNEELLINVLKRANELLILSKK